MKRIGFLLLLMLSLVSCKKPSDRACWKGAGPAQTLQVPFSDFQYLHIHAHMEVTLIQDSLNFVEWEANENLMKFLSAEKDLDTLVLRNLNHCHFLRYGIMQILIPRKWNRYIYFPLHLMQFLKDKF